MTTATICKPMQPEPHLETTRIHLKNILFCTDFSEASQAAFEHATSLAWEFDSNLYILHAEVPVMYAGELGTIDPSLIEKVSGYAKSEMDKLAVHPDLEGIEHKEIISQNAPLSAVEDAVKEYNIDLVVTGTHGAGGLGKVFMGSVAEAVLRKSRCPVLVVGPNSHPREGEYRSILLATDLRPGSLRPAQYAVSIAEETDAKVTLLYVAETLWEIKSHPRREADVMERLEQLLPADAELWSRPNFRVEFGEASTQILDAAGDEKADLIVVGVHDSLLADHAPWATVSKVIRGANCPVLAVRAHV